jgi:hypothetical protein
MLGAAPLGLAGGGGEELNFVVLVVVQRTGAPANLPAPKYKTPRLDTGAFH